MKLCKTIINNIIKKNEIPVPAGAAYFLLYMYLNYTELYVLVFSGPLREKLFGMISNDTSGISIIIAAIYAFLEVVTFFQFARLIKMKRENREGRRGLKIKNYGSMQDFFIRLLPVIGILGTLVGLTSMVLDLAGTMESHFQSESQEALAAAGESFIGIFEGFSTAFSTTLLATLASILMAVKVFILQRAVSVYPGPAGH